MASATGIQTSRQFVILNPVAGNCTAEQVHEALERHFNCADGSCSVHVTTGHDNLAELAREAVRQGCGMVVAAGGDGTVSAVADGLVGSDVPLGIIPLGTANVLAREVGIPLGLEESCALLSGPHAILRIDAMRAAERHFFTQIGIGIDALMIRDTKREAKRRFGRVAYLWTGFVRLIGFQPRLFRLKVDGHKHRRRLGGPAGQQRHPGSAAVPLGTEHQGERRPRPGLHDPRANRARLSEIELACRPGPAAAEPPRALSYRPAERDH